MNRSKRDGDRSDHRPDALGAALRLLGHRSRSTAELRSRLKQRDFPAGEVEETLARLRAWGYLDDRSFAEAWLSDRTKLRPTGRIRLKAELSLKGITPEIIGEVLQARDEEAEVRIAADLLRTRLNPSRASFREASGQQTRDITADDQRRLMGFLLRRGFSSAIARRAFRTLSLEAGTDDPEP